MTTQQTAHTPVALVPRHAGRTWGGFRNLLGKEMGRWWRTRLWWVQALVWTLLVGGICAIVAKDSSGMTPKAQFEESVLTFFGLGVVAIGIGIVATVQGAVIGEKELGTAAWVMSKPASRVSFIVSKMTAHTVSFVLTGALTATAAFLVVARPLLPLPIEPGPFAKGLAVLVLSVTFYVVLTIALGTMFDGRAPVVGIGVGVILAGQVLKGTFPVEFVMVTPWPLPEVATSLVTRSIPDWNRMVPVVATAVLTVVLALVAIWRFQREEF